MKKKVIQDFYMLFLILFSKNLQDIFLEKFLDFLIKPVSISKLINLLIFHQYLTKCLSLEEDNSRNFYVKNGSMNSIRNIYKSMVISKIFLMVIEIHLMKRELNSTWPSLLRDFYRLIKSITILELLWLEPQTLESPSLNLFCLLNTLTLLISRYLHLVELKIFKLQTNMNSLRHKVPIIHLLN
jgi:hypothetical protein